MATYDQFDEVLRPAAGGDVGALAELWRRHNPALVAYLRACDRSFADDLASETWLSVARSLPSFAGDEQAFRGWLFTIARRRVLDHRRRDGRRPTTPLDTAPVVVVAPDDPERSAVTAAGTRSAIDAISALPPDQAEVLLLRVIADLDVATVAELVGKQPGALRVLCHRGLRRLAERSGAAAAGETSAEKIPDAV